MPVTADVIPRRPTLFFILVLVLLLVLMSMSSRTRNLGETRTLFERTVMTAFSPVPKAVNAVGQSTSDAYRGYFDMRHAVTENVVLKKQVVELTTENLKLRQSEGDLRRVRSLLGYADQFSMPTTMAQAIMLDTSGSFKSMIVDPRIE